MDCWVKIKKHLICNDKIMEELIELYGKPTLFNSLIPETNLFDSLANSIISQQLSVQVVKNIKRKLYELGAVEKFNPDLFITSSYEDLRNCTEGVAMTLNHQEVQHLTQHLKHMS